MPNDNTSLDLLAAYLGKKPDHLLKNRPFRNAILKLIYANGGGGGGAVSSVFTRTGDIVATTGDYIFSQIGSTPTTTGGYGITDAVSLTGVQTLTNKTLTSPTLTTPVLGTPSSGLLTSCTGLPISTGVSGLATGIATFLATPSSANLISAVTDETGTGALVFATSPTFVTPILGVATATTVNKVTITAPATNATLTLAQGSTLATAGAFSQTLTATAATTLTLPTSGTLPSIIASGNVSAATSCDINFAPLFNLYAILEIYIYNIIPATNATNLLMRVSTDGTTFDAGASNYSWELGFAAGTTAGAASSAGDTSMEIAASLDNTAGVGSSGKVVLFNPGSATFQPSIKGELVPISGGATGATYFSGRRLTAQVTKGVRFIMSSGNVSMSYRVIGYV